MPLLFPRRITRFLLSLIYAVFFVWATWMSAFVFEFNDEDRLYCTLFCRAFAVHGCWLGARHARYVFRRESVHLDAGGITFWHNDVRQWVPCTCRGRTCSMCGRTISACTAPKPASALPGATASGWKISRCVCRRGFIA